MSIPYNDSLNGYFAEGGSFNMQSPWDSLSSKEKADVMKVAIQNGITNLVDIRNEYNRLALQSQSEEYENVPSEGNYAVNEGPSYGEVPENEEVNLHAFGNPLKTSINSATKALKAAKTMKAADTAARTGKRSKSIYDNSSAALAMNYFIRKGLAPHQAAGLVGNLMRESGLNPLAINPGSKAYGLAQWLGARKKKLFSMYGNKPTLQNQLDFVWWELNNTHKNGLKYLMAARNAEEAARAGMNWFEFSNGDAISEMNRWGQDGRGSMRKGIEFASKLAGQPVPDLAYLDAPTPNMGQYQMYGQMPMGYGYPMQQFQNYDASLLSFQPSNPQAFFGSPYNAPVQNTPQQPLVDTAQYDALMKEQEKTQRALELQDKRNKTGMLLSLVGSMGQPEDSGNAFSGVVNMLSGFGNQSSYGGPLEQHANIFGNGSWLSKRISNARNVIDAASSAAVSGWGNYVNNIPSNVVTSNTVNELPEVVVTSKRRNTSDFSSFQLPDIMTDLQKQNEERQSFVGNIVNNMTEMYNNAMAEAENKYKIKQNAIARANRRSKGPIYNATADLQDRLWEIGAFNGIQGKDGKPLSYDKAVDGINGRMTKNAILNAAQMGYAIDLDTGSVSEASSPIISISKKTDLNAILEHKRRVKANDTYMVIDKKSKTLSVYRGTKLLEQHPVTLGKNYGDGLALTSTRAYSEQPRTTGAGIFNVSPRPASPYVGKEPMFILTPDSVGKMAIAVHSPANNTDRMAPFKNPKLSKRVSYGCVSPNEGIVKHLYEDGIINAGDSVYVLPEIVGNAMIEKNGKLQMSWGDNNPSTYTDEKGNVRKFRYNNKK